jgi:hypothetical protein
LQIPRRYIDQELEGRFSFLFLCIWLYIYYFFL